MSRASGKTWADIQTITPGGKKTVPEGVWIRCSECSSMLFRKAVENNLWVCPECNHHFRISARQRLEQLSDTGSFEPFDTEMTSVDPLGFTDLKQYPDRLAADMRKTGENEGIQTGQAFIKGRKVILASLDLTFMMGSMGSVVGEKLTRAVEAAAERDLPLVVVSCSGGARMQGKSVV